MGILEDLIKRAENSCELCKCENDLDILKYHQVMEQQNNLHFYVQNVNHNLNKIVNLIQTIGIV